MEEQINNFENNNKFIQTLCDTIIEGNETDNNKILEMIDKYIILTLNILNEIIKNNIEEQTNICPIITNMKDIQNDIISLINTTIENKIKNKYIMQFTENNKTIINLLKNKTNPEKNKPNNNIDKKQNIEIKEQIIKQNIKTENYIYINDTNDIIKKRKKIKKDDKEKTRKLDKNINIEWDYEHFETTKQKKTEK